MTQRASAPDLVRIRPRPSTVHIGRGRSVLATAPDGRIESHPDHGLFVHETRVLSRLRYWIDDAQPSANASSTVRQHHWLAYFVIPAPGVTPPPHDDGSGQVPDDSRNTLELRVTRAIGDGLHEDVDLTNFTSERTTFVFSIELDGDFADQSETRARKQHGERTTQWDGDGQRLTFGYAANAASSNGVSFRAERSGVEGSPDSGVNVNRSDGEPSRRSTASPAKVDPHDPRAAPPPRSLATLGMTRGATLLRRSLEIKVARASSPATYINGRLSFAVTLEPQERWHACLLLSSSIDGERLQAPAHCYGIEDATYAEATRVYLEETTCFEAPGSSTLTTEVLATIEQARSDLVALRLFDLDHSPRAWTVAAGLPLYVALFGRDTLTTGWQAGLLGPEIMSGTLHTLAELQGTREDDWRDEQPGKMLHEAHTGPLSMLGLDPRDRSYSSITTSGLYAFIVAELWHWTGDKELVRPFIEPALRVLQWLERYGDIDGDGFYEYERRSPMGPVHQAWKDSPDAIVYEDGGDVDAPIATCEEQAFVYVAKLHLAETLWGLGEHDLSRKLYRESVELKKRFNEAFWMEEEGFFALALDAQKRPVRSIASNAGHCIAAAIADASLVTRTADRMFAPDLFSGWGIRTLSSDHPRYNPYSYHLGSIWPVEHGTFALGFWRYGLHDRVQQIARAQFEAAALFEYHRLPELFGGQPRNAEHPFPAIYPNANPLQAWSSSSVFALLQAMLGLFPYAPLKMLVIDPHLPDWLPEITLRNLRVGAARVSIRFHRSATDRTDYRIVEQTGTLHVVRQATPWSLTSQPAVRLWDALASLLPGH